MSEKWFIIHERAEVNPGTDLLEIPMDGLNKQNDVVSTVEEEAGDNHDWKLTQGWSTLPGIDQQPC